MAYYSSHFIVPRWCGNHRLDYGATEIKRSIHWYAFFQTILDSITYNLFMVMGTKLTFSVTRPFTGKVIPARDVDIQAQTLTLAG